jgi:2-dehydropantoate 2-reductase
MRVAVYGTGGAGGYFGAQLARAGEDVVFIARGEHLEAIRNHGLRLETPSGSVIINPILATNNPAEAGVVDVILVGVKAWQVAEAGKAMMPLIGRETIVVPLQNGVEASTQLAAALGREHVLGGLCGTFSWVTAPGQIKSIGQAHFIKFGELDNRRSERSERLREAFEKAGVTVEVPTDIHKALWGKFILVTSFGGMGAVTRAPIGVIRSVPETRRLLEECINEVALLARACEVELSHSVVTETMALTDSLPEAATTSLQRDIIEGKPSELEAWNGAVVRLGEQRGVQVPLHNFIYKSLLPQEQRARGKLLFPT